MVLFTSSDGIVSYDGMDINQIHSEDISKFIGIVLQDVQLFSGSVKENITMGRTNISEEDISKGRKNFRGGRIYRKNARGLRPTFI